MQLHIHTKLPTLLYRNDHCRRLGASAEVIQAMKKQSHGVISLRFIPRNLLPDYLFPLKITCKIMYTEH